MVLRGLPGSRTVQADAAAAQAGGLGANGEQSVDIVLCVGMARRMQGLRRTLPSLQGVVQDVRRLSIINAEEKSRNRGFSSLYLQQAQE